MAFFNNMGININPFSTQVGQRIEEATDSNQASENWALILEVCDIINGSEDGPKDAIKAIKKRLQQNAGKNYKIVLYTLILLEACVKNCNRKFHVLVCSKDFIQELIKLIGPKNDPPIIVQEKVLSLIQSWADAFYNQPEMSAVVQMYNDLKSKGIEFPMTDLDAMAPIHTPNKITQNKPNCTTQTKIPMQQQKIIQSNNNIPNLDSEESVSLSPEQMAKLRSELDIVQENMNIFNEMLTELTPGKEHSSDLELLMQLYQTCKTMQDRLVELISQLSDDEVTADLLRINDLLNNLFLRYSRYENNRTATLASQSHNLTKKEPASLIDFNADDESKTNTDLNKDFTALNINQTSSKSLKSDNKSVPDFDMFAQSRSVTYESSKKEGSTYEDNLKPNQMAGGLAAAVTQSRLQPSSLDSIIGMHNESDFDEMAAWLGEQAASTETDSLTSSEFDRFLAERAAAAENPSDQQPIGISSASRNTTSQRNKQTSKDMFAI